VVSYTQERVTVEGVSEWDGQTNVWRKLQNDIQKSNSDGCNDGYKIREEPLNGA
jgi:hypothetical protein